MITFLASPKNFEGIIGEIQRKAIYSWKNLHSNNEVFLYGDSSGTKEICVELSLVHVPQIECTEFGTPIFNSIVKHAKKYAKNEIHAYINCDILLLSHNFLRR